jgi:LPS-assembly lipoprotein
MQQLVRFSGASGRARASLGAALVLALAGCGFHLQGAGTLPVEMTRTFVDTDRPHTEFLQSLTDVLRQRGAEVLEAPADGAAVLDISSDETGQRVLSVSARNIPREYEVYYAVTFSLRAGTETLIANESLVVTRSYTYDEKEVLAKAAEEQILREALAADLARRVLQRIQSLGATAMDGGSAANAGSNLRPTAALPPRSRSRVRFPRA